MIMNLLCLPGAQLRRALWEKYGKMKILHYFGDFNTYFWMKDLAIPNIELSLANVRLKSPSGGFIPCHIKHKD